MQANMDAQRIRQRILTRAELTTVLGDLHRKAKRSANTQLQLIVFRLATCCGLRASEISQLRLDDVVLGTQKPYLRVRKAATKATRGKGSRKQAKGRQVPLWWDGGTLADIIAWKQERLDQGAKAGDPFVCSMRGPTRGKPLSRQALRQKFRSACKSLGKERLATLTIHDGRHSFVSHALDRGCSLPEVRDAAGHADIATTSIYSHALTDDGTVRDIFAVDQAEEAAG